MPRRRDTLRDALAEARLFRWRLFWLAALMALCGLALLARWFELQVVQHQHYATASQSNRVKVQVLAPPRGLIYDRNGVLLAENRASYRLELIPEAVRDMPGTLTALAGLVNVRPLDMERFEQQRRRQRRFEAIPLRRFLTDEEVARFAARRHQFPGVDLAGELNRAYPFGALTAHVVGYVGRVSEADLPTATPEQRASSTLGKSGVERSYDTLLQGLVGYQNVEVDAHGRRLRVLTREAPRPGGALHLNLDVRLQGVAAAALGERTGAVVVMDPRDGAVRALASVPAFDPNLFVGGIEPELYRALLADPQRPLYDRALRGEYPPGSTIKPFMALAGMVNGVAQPQDGTWCPGYFHLEGRVRPYRCWQRAGHGWVDMRAAVSRSCDVYFYDLARRLGINRMHDALALFGLGRVTGVDLVGERAGLLPSPAWKRQRHNAPWYPGETVIAGIGQGYMLTTPLQLAVATTAIATRGVLRVPRLAREAPERSTRITLPESVWQTTGEAMEEVMHGASGTARASGAGALYRIAGKTGTAQVYQLAANSRHGEKARFAHLEDHALFIAYAPAAAPELVVSVLVEHGGGGSSAAAPVARKVFDAALLPEVPAPAVPDVTPPLPTGATPPPVTNAAQPAATVPGGTP